MSKFMSDGDRPDHEEAAGSPEFANHDDATVESSGDGSEAEEASSSGHEEEPVWRNPAYRFVFLFLVYLGAIAFGYPKLRERYEWVLDGLAVFTANVEYYAFSLFFDATSVSDRVVSYKGFAVHIIEECTGVYEVLIFAAAVLAFPTIWPKKWVGLGLGLPMLYFFNVLRIAVLMLVGKYMPQYFDFMHLYFWQATLILMITSVWLLWITQVVNRDWSRTASSP